MTNLKKPPEFQAGGLVGFFHFILSVSNWNYFQKIVSPLLWTTSILNTACFIASCYCYITLTLFQTRNIYKLY